MDTFIKAAKASSYWTDLGLFGPVYGSDLAAALVQYKSGSWAAATNVNFVGGDYTRGTGLTGNGTTKYLRTGFVPSASLTLNSTHLAVYNRAANATGGQIAMGADDATNFLDVYAPLSTGSAFSDQYNQSGAQGRVSGAVVAPYRLMVATRTANNVHTIYQDGSSVASSATTGGGLPAFELYVFAANSSGVANQWTAMPFGMYSAGNGLSGAKLTAFNTHIAALMLAAGRNV